jgi:hypothetical protein
MFFHNHRHPESYEIRTALLAAITLDPLKTPVWAWAVLHASRADSRFNEWPCPLWM